MISAKEYAEMMANTFDWAKRDQKYYETDTLYAEQLSVGVIAINKPRLEKSFCYGYGYGIEYEDAARRMQAVSEKYEVFLRENLNELGASRKLKEIEENPDWVYLQPKRVESGTTFCRWGIVKPWDNPIEEYIKATPEDVEKIKNGLKAQIENLTKRCETYWKKYGSSKLKTWTYWID